VTREAIVCEGDGNRVRMHRGTLCLDYDLRTGRYAVTHGDACTIEGADACFLADGQTVRTTAVRPHRWHTEAPPGPLGPGRQLVLQPAQTEGPLHWSLSFCLHDAFDAVAIALELHNNADEEIELREVRPLVTPAEGRLRLGRSLKTTRLLSNASERTSGRTGVRRVDAGSVCESPVSFVLVDTSAHTALAAGILGPARSFTTFRLELVESAPPTYRLDAIQATPVGASRTSSITLPPGARFAPEHIVLVFAADGHTAFEHYAECSARAAGAARRPVPCGWSSWPCCHANVSEAEVLRNAEFLADTLKPYGLDTILIGPGWQARGDLSGGPWRAGDSFPHGMQWLAAQLRERGFRPGLWIRPLEVDGHRLDPSSEFTRTTLRNEVRRLAERDGFDLLNIGLLHDDAFERDDSFLPDEAAVPAVEALRLTVAAVRDGLGHARALGASNLTLGAGLGVVDSTRAAQDVDADDWRLVKEHTVKAIAARYALHGRWWANDPGAVAVRRPLTLGQARAWASFCALTGGMVIAGDRMHALPAERLDVLKRVMPAYGAGARPVDLFDRELPEVWHLPVEADDERWHVVGLFNWDTTPREIKRTRARTIEHNARRLRANDAVEGRRRTRAELEAIASTNRLIRDENARLERRLADDTFGRPPLELLEPLHPVRPSARFKNIMLHFDRLNLDLGLDPPKEYLVYDFWDNRFLGAHSGRLKVLVRLADCVVLAVHPARGVPQLLSTSRHVTQGGVDLEHLAWDPDRCELAGTSRLVADDDYTMTIHVPPDFEFIGGEADIADVRARHQTPVTLRLTLRSLTSKSARWKIKFDCTDGRAGAEPVEPGIDPDAGSV